jgi:Fe-S oxidoreductase
MRWFRPHREGLEGFRQNYVTEGLPAVPAGVRKVAHSFVRCTGCGACDRVCPLTTTSDPLVWRGPMALVVSMSRAAPHWPESEPALALMGECSRCRACENVCPERIPLLAVAEHMRGALASLHDVRLAGSR